MKHLKHFLFACLALVVAKTTLAQTTLAQYNYSGSGTSTYTIVPTTTATNITASNVTAVAGGITQTTSYQTSPGDFYATLAQASQTSFNASTNPYFQFTVTPATGYQFSISALTFSAGRTAAGPQSLTVQYSTDGFATATDGTTLLSGASNSNTSTLSAFSANAGLPTSGFTGAVTIRIFGFGGTGNGNLRMLGLTVTGTVSAVSGLSSSPSILTGFNYATGTGGPSAIQSVLIQGTNLNANAVVTLSGNTHYEVSGDSTSFGSSATATASGTSLASTKFYVRLKNSLSGGLAYNDTLAISGGGAAASLIVNGYVTGDFYSNATGYLDSLATFTSNTNGTSGTNPASFTGNYQVFHIANNNPGNIFGSNLTISGTGSKITVDRGTSLTVTSTKTITATIDVAAGNTLTISNTTAPTLGTLAASSTVKYLNLPAPAGYSPAAAAIYNFGNVVLDNTVYNPNGFNTWNVAGNITFVNGGAVSYAASVNDINLNLTGTASQTITGNGDTLKFYNITSTNTAGTITLAANTPTIAYNTLQMVQTGTANQFTDGGNYIAVGNNLYLDGNAAGYNLTGTINMTLAAAGTAKISSNSGNTLPVAAALNNLQISTTGATSLIKFYPATGGSTYAIKGSFTVGSGTTGPISFNGNTFNLGGDFNYLPATDIISAGAGNNTIVFNGTGAQAFNSNYITSPGIVMYNVTNSNSGGTVTFNGMMKAGQAFTNSGTISIAGTGLINVAGAGSSITNNGTVNGAGEVSMTGSATQTIAGTGTLGNVEVSKSAVATLSAGSTQTITGQLYLNNTAGGLTIIGNLNMAGGAAPAVANIAAGTLNTGGNLTLMSDINGTAIIGSIAGTLTGAVNIQRYIPGQRGYRLLGQPYTANIDLSQLSTSFDITGITGGSTCTGTSPSAFSYTPGSNPAYVGITNGTGAFPTAANTSGTHANGILAFVRGSKGQDCSSTATTNPSDVTFTTTGTVNQGDITETVPANGWNLIANPYPAQVLLSGVDNISSLNALVVVQPGQQNGGHTYTNGTAYATVTSSFILPINGAFLANNTTGSDIILTFHEASKTTTAPNTGILKTTGAYPQLALSVYNSADLWDNWEMTLKPGTTGSAGETGDLAKQQNAQFNISSMSTDNKQLAWDARDEATITDGTVIGMNISSVPQTTYNLQVSANSLPAGKTAYLHDKYTGTYVALNNGVSYPFTVDGNTASQGANRMELIFNTNNSNTGIGNVANRTAGIMIVPNPATSNINVSYSSEYAGNKNISIVNVTGQVVKQLNTTADNIIIPVDNLANGVYFIKTVANGNKAVTERFIKN